MIRVPWRCPRLFPRRQTENEKLCALRVSGLNFSTDKQDAMLPWQLFTDFVTGQLGSEAGVANQDTAAVVATLRRCDVCSLNSC